MCIRRSLSVILISAMLAVMAVSCSSGSGSEKAVADQSDNLKSGSSKELTMYVASFDTTTQNAVKKFNESHKNVRIKTKLVSSLSQKDLGGKLMYEFNNGGGPDIILCGYETLPNLSVYFEKGAFYDLNTLIGNDKTFSKTKCFEKVLDFGIYKAKRYVIPLSFKIDAMFSTKAIIEKNGIETGNSGMDIGTLSSAAQKYMTNAGGNAENQKYFISGLDFSSLLQTSATPFFDIEKKTASFDSIEFGDLLEKYKGLAEFAATKTLSVIDSQSSDLLASEKVVFQNSGTMTPRYAFLPYRSFKSEVEPVLVPSVSSDTSRHIMAKPEKYIGINAKCGNLKAAYDFIKLMLSVDFQDSDITEGIPVNREAYKQAVDNSLKGIKGYDLWRDGGCRTKKALMQLYSQLDKLVEGIDRCWTTDEYVLTVVENEVDTYLAGNSKKEDTLKNIQQKVANYFKSGIILEAASDKDEMPVDPDKTITMYYWNSGDYANHSITEFEEQNPGYKVKIKIFDSPYYYFNRTAIELMAGGGPDVVLFHLRTFNSITKVIATGAFCEMDDYIKKYDVIKYDEYNRSLLDGGMLNGKRYYIPLYSMGYKLFSTDKLLEENDLKPDMTGWTWDKFVDCSKEFMRKNKNQGKYFVEGNYGLPHMIVNWEEPLIDYENKKSYFNSASFKKLLELYKELYPSIAPEGSKYEFMMKNRKYLFAVGLNAALYYKYDYEDCKSWGLGNITLVPAPTLTGKRIENTMLLEGIAVNSRCKNKEAAFKFVKIAISYNMQRYFYKNGEFNGSLDIPINRAAFADDLKSYMNSAALLPESIVNKALQVHSIMKPGQVRDYSLIELIEEKAKDYMNGNKTVDQVAKEIDDRVNVFLNE